MAGTADAWRFWGGYGWAARWARPYYSGYYGGYLLRLWLLLRLRLWLLPTPNYGYGYYRRASSNSK